MNFPEIISILQSGGWVMIMLAIMAMILYVTAFELVLFTFRGNLKLKNSGHWPRWVTQPEEASGRVGEIIRYTQQGKFDDKRIRRRFEEVCYNFMSRIDRRLIFVKTLVAAAPLAGLLGTVIGMLTTFDGIAVGGRGETMIKVADGVREALITTQTGLMVALPGVFLALIIQRRREAMEAGICQLESLTLQHCLTEDGRALPKPGSSDGEPPRQSRHPVTPEEEIYDGSAVPA